MNDVDIPPGGTLVQQERNYIWDMLHVSCAVRYRGSWGRRAMSLWGSPEYFQLATMWACCMMEERLGLDVCMQYGGSNEKNK